jgi:4-oxalocrotonate tautomerase
MPYIHVTIASGRTLEQKQSLMKAIAQATQDTLEAIPEAIRVWITEVPPEEMSTGGVPLPEVRAQRAAATAAKHG